MASTKIRGKELAMLGNTGAYASATCSVGTGITFIVVADDNSKICAKLDMLRHSPETICKTPEEARAHLANLKQR